MVITASIAVLIKALARNRRLTLRQRPFLAHGPFLFLEEPIGALKHS